MGDAEGTSFWFEPQTENPFHLVVPDLVPHNPNSTVGEECATRAVTNRIADMAIFPWCRLHERQGQNLDDFPNVKRWFAQIAARPAVAKDMDALEDVVGEFDEESWSASFGDGQDKRR